jgi:hypothetical protein
MKITKILVLIAYIPIFAISSSCGTDLINVKEKDSPDAVNRYTNFVSIRYGFSVDIPQGFEMDGMEGRLTSWSYRYVPPDEEGEAVYDFGAVPPTISVIAKDIPEGYSEMSIFDANLRKIEGEMAERISDYTDLEILEIDGGYALRFKETARDDPNAINHRFLHLFINRRHYILDISATYKVMDDWKSSFDHVLKSFMTN